MSNSRDFTWYFWCAVHNCLVHPILPAADLLDQLLGPNSFSNVVYHFHDVSAPNGGG